MRERSTRQREAIRSVFETAGAPLTPEEVLEAARRSTPHLGIATVYRTIAALLREGWLAQVAVPGTAPRYEREDGGHHHHFRCRACDRVFDVGASDEELLDRLPAGFELEGHSVVLYGRCADCARGGSVT
jgi:Fur family ferric uptake transcriptional regulator